MTIGDLLDLQGSFRFSFLVDPSTSEVELEIIADPASLELAVIGSLRVTGAMRVNSSGLVTHIGVTLDAGIGGDLGLEITGSAVIQLNTSDSTQSFELESGEIVDVRSGFLLEITGSVEFLGLASASGSVTITIVEGEFSIEFDVEIDLGAITLDAFGFAGIFTDDNPGLVLILEVDLDVNIFEIFKIEAGGYLELNTTDCISFAHA